MAKRSSRQKVKRPSSNTVSVTRTQTGAAPPASKKKVAATGRQTMTAKRPTGRVDGGGGRATAGDGGGRTSPHIISGRIRGMSLTWKFALVIGFMIAFVMLVFAAVMYIQVEQNLYREKKLSGLYFCNALAPLTVTYLLHQGAITDNVLKTVGKVYQDSMDKDGVVNAVITIKTERGSAKLPGLGEIMTISRNPKYTDILEIDGKRYDDITLCEDGTVKDTGEKVFWFNKTFIFNDKTVNIFVILSKKSIEDSQKKLVVQIVAIGVSCVIFGFLIAFGLASVVVKPVRQLVHDMALVSSGKLDHRTTAHSKDEIGLLANTFNLMTKSLLDAQELEREKLLLDSELTVASDIQARLLPEKTPQMAGYQMVPFYRSAKDVGGDYYDFIPLDRDHLGIIVADVSGKGIIGSLVMSITRTVLRLVSQGNISAADTLSKANRVIAQDIRRGMFVTAFYAILNARKRELIYSSAGHNPMVVYRADKRKVELANPKGIALGFNKGPIFDKTVKEERLTLNSGDMIVLYTDGVVEAMDNHNEEYTEDRFYKFCLENARLNTDEFVNKLMTDLDNFTGTAPQSDDITVVALKLE